MSLPKPPGVIRQFWARHPWWTDSIVAAAYFLPVFFGIIALGSGVRTLSAANVTVWVLSVCLMTAALLFRRHRPWLVLAIAWGVALVAFPLTGSVDALAMPLALYAIAVYRSTRDAWIALAGSAVVGTVAAFLASGINRTANVLPLGAPPAGASTQDVVLMLIATLIGINMGNRRRYLAALIDRAAQLAHERDQQAQLAAAAERARIAREMHDIVSHSLTVMVSLADGSAALAIRSPERSEHAMRQVAETGRHALADMRRMLGVLHDDSWEQDGAPAALAPQPGAGDLSTLVETFRTAGLPIRLTVSGVPPLDLGQQLTLYRIVQESLTNVLRYAADALSVAIDVAYTPTLVSVAVEDDGHGSAARSQGAGRGLVGMRERVGLYGGYLESGPRPGGGWRVHATFPPADEHGDGDAGTADSGAADDSAADDSSKGGDTA